MLHFFTCAGSTGDFHLTRPQVSSAGTKRETFGQRLCHSQETWHNVVGSLAEMAKCPVKCLISSRLVQLPASRGTVFFRRVATP